MYFIFREYDENDNDDQVRANRQISFILNEYRICIPCFFNNESYIFLYFKTFHNLKLEISISTTQTLHYIEKVITPRARPFGVGITEVDDFLDIALIKLGRF